MLNRSLYLIITVSLALSCDQTKQRKSAEQKNLHFGHRGSGAHIYDGKMIENTKSSVEFALTHLDGCEIDIQMSKEGTIWIYHDDMLGHFCDSSQLDNVSCIPQMSDAAINKLKQCREGVEDRIYQLSDVFDLFVENNFHDKFLSLDVKGYFSEECFPSKNAPKVYFEQFADALTALIERYSITDQVIVESNYDEFMDRIKSISSDLTCHYIGYNNFDEKIERVIAKNYDGISFSLFDSELTKNHIDSARKLGLDVQLWPVTDSSLLEKAKKLEPFSFQVSKMKLVH